MDKMFQNNSGEQSEHPPRELLLVFVDGELPAKETAQLEVHLEACWPCRVKTKKIQEAIADIIEFDEQVLTPRLLPPGGWRNFDRQLRQLAAQSGSQSLMARVMGSLGKFLPVARFAAARQSRGHADSGSSVRNEMFIASQRPSFSLSPFRGDISLLRSWLRAQPLRFVMSVLFVVAIAALVVYFKHEPVVSASELLKNVIDAQTQQLRATVEPVVHQKLRVRRRDQASAHEESVNLEIWNDTRNLRYREFATTVAEGENGQRDDTLSPSPRLPVSPSPRLPVMVELTQVLAANYMDPQRPLSAASYQSWHSTLQHQQDEVTRSKLADGADVLTLRTVPASPVTVGQIAEAVFIVRARDWEPGELRLNVHTEGGNRIYELTEDLSEVLNLAQVDPTIFADEKVASAPAPAKTSSPAPTASPGLKPAVPALTSDLRPLTSAVASADLEVEALQLLNQVGADLGEQISTKRTAEGTLQISGVVETDQRMTEIVKALAPIANNPAVHIEIQTVAEAVAKQSNVPAPSPSTRAVEIAGNTMAAEPELRVYFAREGGDSDQAVRRFAARMVGLSNQGMDHLWATKRLLNQFSPEEQRALTPDARVKWLGLIRAHARSYQQSTQSLRRELQPVFFPSQSAGGVSANGAGISDTNELSRAVEQLFELGSSNDRVIRSAFTSSSSGAMTTVIKAPQFWQSLKNAESLAGKIARSE